MEHNRVKPVYTVKPVYDQIEIDIAVGNPSFSDRVELRKGICTGVKYINLDGINRDHGVDLEVKNSSGDALIGNTDYRDYINTGGDYNGNYKPCIFDTKANILVNLNCEAGVNIAGTPLKGRLIFRIEQPCKL